jgi:pilus assembly protein Flp/PilA
MVHSLSTFVAALRALRYRLRREEGATAVEYGMLVALIAVVVVALAVLLGPQIAAAFDAIIDALTGAGVPPAPD